MVVKRPWKNKHGRKTSMEVLGMSIYADTTSLTVVLISLAVTVFFAEPIRAVVPINLLLLLIIAHVLYIGVRYCIKDYRKSMGYY